MLERGAVVFRHRRARHGARALRAFIERTGADELMITSQIFDHAARLRSYEIAAQRSRGSRLRRPRRLGFSIRPRACPSANLSVEAGAQRALARRACRRRSRRSGEAVRRRRHVAQPITRSCHGRGGVVANFVSARGCTPRSGRSRPRKFEAATVPHDRVEGCEHALPLVRPHGRIRLRAGRYQIDPVVRACQRCLARLQGRRALRGHCGAPRADGAPVCPRVLAGSGACLCTSGPRAHPCVHSRRRSTGRCTQSIRRTASRTAFTRVPPSRRATAAPTIVHHVERLVLAFDEPRTRFRHLAVREMRVHLARVHRAALVVRVRTAPAARRTPPSVVRAVRGCVSLMGHSRQITVIDEEVLLERQPRITAPEVARAIRGHTVRAGSGPARGGGADRVSLHGSQLVDGALEGGRLEQRTRDGVATQMIQRDPHAAMIFQSANFLVH